MAFPSFETTFIVIQFGLVFPLYLFLSLYATSAYALFLMCVYVLLLVLVPMGMPGSIIGWMTMLCAGYFFGVSLIKENSVTLGNIKPFFYLTIFSCLWVILGNYRNGFSQELLSDYFQASSINTVPLLMVCSFNLYCGIYYYTGCIAQNRDDTVINKYKLLFALLFVAILTTVLFGFRSGALLFVLLPLVVWESLKFRRKIIRNIVLFLFAGFGFFSLNNLYNLLVNFFLPGRSEIVSLVGDLSEDTLRYDRIGEFWSVASLSKLDFDVWSSHFSVSAMSDFIAGLFPLSLLFFIPALSMLKLVRYMNSAARLPALIILVSTSSSLLISVLQPDFYSMFTFFAISSMVFFGEKRRVPLLH
tara:strand:- start:6263 stop:7342 length:1080 start_codon:yes stop_codon:yes gene_type:complete